MLPIGIDISKASFDVAFLDDDKYQNKKFKNDLKGDLNKTLFSPKSDKILIAHAHQQVILSYED
jgi:hypothetical protein